MKAIQRKSSSNLKPNTHLTTDCIKPIINLSSKKSKNSSFAHKRQNSFTRTDTMKNQQDNQYAIKKQILSRNISVANFINVGQNWKVQNNSVKYKQQSGVIGHNNNDLLIRHNSRLRQLQQKIRKLECLLRQKDNRNIVLCQQIAYLENQNTILKEQIIQKNTKLSTLAVIGGTSWRDLMQSNYNPSCIKIKNKEFIKMNNCENCKEMTIQKQKIEQKIRNIQKNLKNLEKTNQHLNAQLHNAQIQKSNYFRKHQIQKQQLIHQFQDKLSKYKNQSQHYIQEIQIKIDSIQAGLIQVMHNYDRLVTEYVQNPQIIQK